MRRYQISGRPEILGFTNYQRVDEKLLFDDVLHRIKANVDIEMGSKKISPSEEYYLCRISGLPFTLIFDLNYGPSIWSESPEAICKLKNYFN
ncbi:MAG: hypothetical protein EOM34_09135 [Clostridia bacterium]|nr:hypothetical protein [Clostridia bacterium]NCD02059.1 hypothetical protein [Clostridia bacterium]